MTTFPQHGDNFTLVGQLHAGIIVFPPTLPRESGEEAAPASPLAGVASSSASSDCGHCSCVHREGAACCECEYAPKAVAS